MDFSDKVATFISFTSSDADVAAQFLELFEGDVVQAVNAFLEGGTEAPTGKNPHPHLSDEEPKPLESMPKQKVMRLVDTPGTTPLLPPYPFEVVTQVPYLPSNSSVFEPFRNFANEQGGKGNKGKKDALARLFAPPYKLFSGTTYEEVDFLSLVLIFQCIKAGKRDNQYLIVNIQGESCLTIC